MIITYNEGAFQTQPILVFECIGNYPLKHRLPTLKRRPRPSINISQRPSPPFNTWYYVLYLVMPLQG